MRWMIIPGMLLAMSPAATGQPADCLTAPPSGPLLPLSLDLAGRHGVPPDVTGQAYVSVPTEIPGMACAILPPPSDVLRGAHGDLLNPASE